MVGTELPSSLDVALRWRGRPLRLTLFRSDVGANKMMVVYEDLDHNDTVVERLQERCQYQGFLRKDAASESAVSTCNGLAGYIQTEKEMLFVEPAPAEREGSRLWGHRPHLIYTCKDQELSLSGNFTDTGEPIATMEADPRPRRRRRRSTGRKKYLEVQMVVDHTVVAMHGKERVKDYAMTLMNIANSVYQHHTLGINLRVVVTELILLSKEDQKYVVVKRDALRTVQQFCQWSAYRRSPARGVKHDIAVLLTREKMGPAGYAPITGLCYPDRACAAITDEGFTSGFIIAHEMAHVFGLFHDGHGNHCSGRRYSTAIMAPLVEAKLNNYWWSECSKQRMQHVIPYLFCLNDEPDMAKDVNHYELDSGPQLADDMGKHWSLDFQCRLEFGDYFGVCLAFASDQCSMLWCSHRATPHLCRTKRGPPASGTTCGYERECRNSRCTYVGNEKAVDGNWASWSDWGECSMECGVGIKKRHRTCTDPKPAYGGKECEGESETWDTCASPKCDIFYDALEGHCAVWNEMNVRPGQHDWKPYQTKHKSKFCKQTCMSSRTREVVTLDIEISDGAPCDYDNPTNICYQGKCLSVGCDGVRNSSKTYDSCGNCGGDDSQCKVVSGIFKSAPSAAEEYESVVYLPKGARNIEIVQRGKTQHFLALKEAVYGRYALNGNKRRETSRELIIAGARFDYTSRGGHQTIVSRGPVHSDIEVMLYPGKDLGRASVTYEYSVRKDDYTLEKRKYQWKFKEWSDCSVTCGDGVTVITHSCYDKDSGEEVADEKCQYVDLPRKDEAKCVREPCSMKKYIWAMTNDWSDCNATECGEEGVETQGYICELYYMNNGTYAAAQLEDCDQNNVPAVTRNCSAPPCPELKWVIGQWSECSTTCGKGQQSRRVHCGDPDTDSDDIFCKEMPPPLSQSCENKPCKNAADGNNCQNKYSFCSFANNMAFKCRSKRFREICCKACRKAKRGAGRAGRQLSSRKYRRRQRRRRRRY